MNANELTERLKAKDFPRLAWFRQRHYAPFVFHIMNEREREVLLRWFESSEGDWPHGNGASGFTAMSIISGALLSSGVNNLVQCGHYIGFSSIILGSVFRYMGKKNALYSMDVHEKAHRYALKWVEEAGLSNVVKCVLRSSDEPENIVECEKFFGRTPETVFIDSSHNYSHTMRELDLWFGALPPGGLLFLHDVSNLAKSYDSQGKGGVKAALLEFLGRSAASGILLNGVDYNNMIYADTCGLGIIQKI